MRKLVTLILAKDDVKKAVAAFIVSKGFKEEDIETYNNEIPGISVNLKSEEIETK